MLFRYQGWHMIIFIEIEQDGAELCTAISSGAALASTGLRAGVLI